MKKTKHCAVVLLAVLSLTGVAGAQEFPNEPYDFLMAKVAAEEGRFDEALQRIDRVLRTNPADPILLYERAMILVDAGRIPRAESELRALAAKNPEFYDANRVLGRILLDRSGGDRKGVTEALVYLQAALKANPDDLSTGVAVSQLLTSLERHAEAERVLASLVERAPDQRGLNYAYAQVLTKLGRGSESRQYLERAVAIDATFAPAIMQLLDIYQQENEWLKAAQLLQPLLDDDALNVEMQRQQAYFYLRAGDAANARDRFRTLVAADPADTRSLFYLAEAYNDLEQYADAEKIFRPLLEKTPTDADLVASFGLSLAGQKKWDEASKTFTRLLTLGGAPDNLVALARTQLAYVDLQKQNYDAAVETAKPILEFRDRPNAQAINIAVEALRKQEKNAEVLALIAPLAKKYDTDPFVNARYVDALIRSGKKSEARAHAATQAKLGPRNAIASAEAFAQTDDYPSAIILMTNALSARPEDVDLQFQLGALQERSGNRKAAEKTFLALLDRNADHAPSLNYLGYMWAESGENLKRAEDMLTRAVGQEPDNGAYVDSLGWVYFRLGNLELAEKYLTDATRLLPRDATVHDHLGDVLVKRGEMNRALETYRAAINIDPESKDNDKIRLKIAEIERRSQTTQR